MSVAPPEFSSVRERMKSFSARVPAVHSREANNANSETFNVSQRRVLVRVLQNSGSRDKSRSSVRFCVRDNG